MKILFILILFTTILFIRAKKVELDLGTIYDQDVATSGKVTLLLKGLTTSKKIEFNDKPFFGNQWWVYEDDLVEDISSVTVQWESESKMYIYIKHLTIIYFGEKVVTISIGKDFENGESSEFHKQN